MWKYFIILSLCFCKNIFGQVEVDSTIARDETPIMSSIIVYYLVIISKQLQATLKFPSTDVLKQNRTNFTKIRPIIYVFRLLAIILIIISLARPQTKETSTRIKTTRGIDIVMVIDISSSMLAKDLKPFMVNFVIFVIKYPQCFLI